MSEPAAELGPPVTPAAYRCSIASESRGDSLAGSASTVRAFLLVEHPGPWGVDALRDARIPDGLGPELKRRAGAAKVRALLVRRPRGGSRAAEGVRVFAGFAHHLEPFCETTVLDDFAGLRDLDLEALGAGESPGLTPHDRPVLAVCTQGRHDACCAERGRPAVAALLDRHADLTWEVSHIGGDRFAANLLVLPWGLYYGRVDATSGPVIADALLAGELVLDHLRGRSTMASALQAAEIGLRQHLDVRGIDAVRFQRRVVDGELTEATFEVAGAAWTVTVRSGRTVERYRMTCRAARENPAPVHEILEVRAS